VVYGKTKTSVPDTKWIRLKPDDFFAELTYKNGTKRRVEFYYGSTYLSQSSRIFTINKEMQKVKVTNFKGAKRELF